MMSCGDEGARQILRSWELEGGIAIRSAGIAIRSGGIAIRSGSIAIRWFRIAIRWRGIRSGGGENW